MREARLLGRYLRFDGSMVGDMVRRIVLVLSWRCGSCFCALRRAKRLMFIVCAGSLLWTNGCNECSLTASTHWKGFLSCSRLWHADHPAGKGRVAWVFIFLACLEQGVASNCASIILRLNN